MSVQVQPQVPAQDGVRSSSGSRRLWRLGGGLLIGYVVLTFAVTPLQSSVTVGDKASRASSALVHGSMTKFFVGDYVELIATLVFLVAGLLLARLLRGESESNRWLASCIAAGATVFAAVTIATSFAAGAAALYSGHHGASLSTAVAVNDIRNFGWATSGAVAGLFTLAAAAAGQASRRLPAWLSYAGYAVGVICIAGVPLVRAGEPQTTLWFLWLVVLGVVALRAPHKAP